LVIDIYDAKQEVLIYEAIAMKKVEGVKMEQRYLDLIIRSMMYNFPLQPTSAKKKKDK